MTEPGYSTYYTFRPDPDNPGRLIGERKFDFPSSPSTETRAQAPAEPKRRRRSREKRKRRRFAGRLRRPA